MELRSIFMPGPLDVDIRPPPRSVHRSDRRQFRSDSAPVLHDTGNDFLRDSRTMKLCPLVSVITVSGVDCRCSIRSEFKKSGVRFSRVR